MEEEQKVADVDESSSAEMCEETAAPAEGPADVGTPHGDTGRCAFVYAATCASLRSWSDDLGFEVRHVGVSGDSLSRIRELGKARYARLSYFFEPYEAA